MLILLMTNVWFYFQILGRMLEVLDEVYVPSIPLFYFSGSVLQLYPHVYHALLKNTFSLVYFKLFVSYLFTYSFNIY